MRDLENKKNAKFQAGISFSFSPSNIHQVVRIQLAFPIKSVGHKFASFGDAVVQTANVVLVKFGLPVKPIMPKKNDFFMGWVKVQRG